MTTTDTAAQAIIVPRRSEALADFCRQGGKIAAVFPTKNPRALLRAHGYLPVEVWGPPGVDASQGERHVQPYVCSVVRNAVSFAHSPHSRDVNLFVVPHACDSLQGLGSLLMDLAPPKAPVLPLYLPRNSHMSGEHFLRQELQHFSKKLNKFSNIDINKTILSEAIARESEADALFAELYAARARLPLNDSDFYALIRSRGYLPAERFSPLARQALQMPVSRVERGIPLIVSGLLIEPSAFFAALEQAGAWIAADDLACCGRRAQTVETRSESPWEALSQCLLSEQADPLLGQPIDARVHELLEKVQLHQARGIIFYTVKFCEPELFDQPMLVEALKAKNIPSLRLEVDINDALSGQLRTRVEAFCEMLS